MIVRIGKSLRERMAAVRQFLATATLQLLGVRIEELPSPPSVTTPNAVETSLSALGIKTLADADTALKITPNDAHLYAIRGSLLIHENQLALAVAAFTTAIELDSKQSLYRSGRALAHLSGLQHAEAIADCTEALRLDQNNREALQVRGTAYAESKQYRAAEADFQAVYRLKPDDARSISNLAWLRFLQKDFDVALRLTSNALEHDPADPTAHYVRGKILASQKQTALARIEFQIALQNWTNMHTPYGQRFFDDLTRYIERYS